MQEYAAKTAPLKAYYARRGQVVELDGLGAPEAILAETRRQLGRLGRLHQVPWTPLAASASP